MVEDLQLPAHKQPFTDLVLDLKHPESAGAAGGAAMIGAIAGGLTAKVATLTIGKEGFEAVSEEMQRINNRAIQVAEKLAGSVEHDPQAQLRLTQAFHLPQGTPDESEIRRSCLDLALKKVVQVPIGIAQLAIEVLALAENVSRYGNPGAASEGALAMASAITAIKGATAAANSALKSVTDEVWAGESREEIAKILEKVAEAEGDPVRQPMTVPLGAPS